jgi:hypothetical protein
MIAVPSLASDSGWPAGSLSESAANRIGSNAAYACSLGGADSCSTEGDAAALSSSCKADSIMPGPSCASARCVPRDAREGVEQDEGAFDGIQQTCVVP